MFFKINLRTSRMHPLKFLWTPKGFIFSPEYLLSFFSNLYIAPWLRESSKFMVLKLLENVFVTKKIKSVHFSLCPQAKMYPRFLSLPIQEGGNYPFPPHNSFCIFSQQKGRRIMELKKWPNQNLQGHWSQVLKSCTNFSTITFLDYIL